MNWKLWLSRIFLYSISDTEWQVTHMQKMILKNSIANKYTFSSYSLYSTTEWEICFWEEVSKCKKDSLMIDI